MISRRELIVLVGSAATLPASAQSATQRPLVAVLEGTSQDVSRYYLSHFEQALRERGRINSDTIEIVSKFADGDAARYPALAEELVRLKPAVIVTGSTTGALACRNLTSTIPIVSSNLTDPVGMGLVSSLAKPGGNVTGVVISLEGQPGKLLQFLLELKPGVTRIGVLANPNERASARQLQAAESVAAGMGLTLVVAEVRSREDFAGAFDVLSRARAEAIYVPSSLLLRNERKNFADLALAARLPAVCNAREIVEAGGLMSYGVDLRENYRRSAYFVDRILQGTPPTDLPTENPRKFFTSVNLKTARVLGIAIPPTLHAIADEMIE
jgi:putative tryptophan/tyrosine transport system substrate-binding protein